MVWDSLSLRRAALQIFQAALEAVSGATAVRRHLVRAGSLLQADGVTIDLTPVRRLFVVGAGKAAGPMAAAVEEILGDRLTAGCVVVKYGHGVPISRVRLVEAGHPVPDAAGLRAADEILRMAREATAQDLLLVLLSGGGSALLPLPAPGIRLTEKQEVTSLLLGCGATIQEINTVRSHLSRIKGGQLAAAAAPARTLSLLLSDVVGDSLQTIASGPTAPDPSTFADAEALLERYDLVGKVPVSVREHLRAGVRGERPETPKPGDRLFATVTNLIVGSLREALTAAAEAAHRLGLTPQILTSTLQGEAREVARLYGSLTRQVRTSRDPTPPPACLLTGGETTVTLSGLVGRGGRNMELAAAAALALQDLPQVLLLSAGTDGTDGPTDAAGALVDGTTCARAKTRGLDLERALQRHDTYPLFQALGDLVVTGPTGTNVMDMQILLVGEGESLEKGGGP